MIVQIDDSYIEKFIQQEGVEKLKNEFPEDLLKSDSLGIKLIHLTARQLGGDVTITSPEGLKYEIRFPCE